MADRNDDIRILIEAENLASNEFKQVSEDSEKLAKKLDAADKALAKIKIDQGHIASFKQLGEEVESLSVEIKQSEADYKKMATATSADVKAKEASARSILALKNELKPSTPSIRKHAKPTTM